MTKKLKKPIKKYVSEPTWDYHEVIHYLEEKYSFESRGYTPAAGFTQEIKDEYYKEHPHRKDWEGEERIYLDFWHWLLDNSFAEVNNGSFAWIPVKEYLDDDDTPSWVKEILQKMYTEFKEDDMEFWIAW